MLAWWAVRETEGLNFEAASFATYEMGGKLAMLLQVKIG